MKTTKQFILTKLKSADQLYDINTFSLYTVEWFKLNPDKNLQDFETFLRENEFNTHVIASTYVPGPGNLKAAPSYFDYVLSLHGKVLPELKYCCLFSCRPFNIALDELKTHWKDYDENYSKLKETGFLQKK